MNHIIMPSANRSLVAFGSGVVLPYLSSNPFARLSRHERKAATQLPKRPANKEAVTETDFADRAVLTVNQPENIPRITRYANTSQNLQVSLFRSPAYRVSAAVT